MNMLENSLDTIDRNNIIDFNIIMECAKELESSLNVIEGFGDSEEDKERDKKIEVV